MPLLMCSGWARLLMSCKRMPFSVGYDCCHCRHIISIVISGLQRFSGSRLSLVVSNVCAARSDRAACARRTLNPPPRSGGITKRTNQWCYYLDNIWIIFLFSLLFWLLFLEAMQSHSHTPFVSQQCAVNCRLSRQAIMHNLLAFVLYISHNPMNN